MLTVTTLKLTLDIALGAAILYLCYRTARTSPHSKVQPEVLRELQSSLTGLLQQADQASVDLTDSLARKQKQLEELLFDIETVEHRLNKGVDEAESVRKSLQRVTSERSGQHQQEEQQAPVRAPEVQPREKPQYAGASEQRAVEQAAPTVRRNIYGEPIEQQPSTMAAPPQAPPAPEPRVQGLRAAIEKHVEPPQSVQRSLEDVYAHCEELIRAGTSVAEIARTTQMTEDEVETLRGILMVEADPIEGEESQEIVEQDSRLGVLPSPGRGNPIGRTTQIL